MRRRSGGLRGSLSGDEEGWCRRGRMAGTNLAGGGRARTTRRGELTIYHLQDQPTDEGRLEVQVALGMSWTRVSEHRTTGGVYIYGGMAVEGLGSAGLAQVCGVIRQGMAPHRPSSTVGRVKTRGELALRGVGELHQPGLGAPLGWVMLRVSRVKIYIPRDCMFVCVHLNTWHA